MDEMNKRDGRDGRDERDGRDGLPRLLPPALLTVILVIIALAFPAPLPAAEMIGKGETLDLEQPADTPRESVLSPESEPALWLQTLRMLAGLTFILGLLGVGAWLLRRHAARAESGARTDVIRIVASKMLGGRKNLLLVRVRGQTLLLGITPQSITFLTEIQEIEGEWAQPPAGSEFSSANPRKPSSPFGRKLGAFIERTISDEPPKN